MIPKPEQKKIDRDIVNLDYAVAKFVLPRLKAYKKASQGHPSTLTWEEWLAILDKMIWAFEYIGDEHSNKYIPKKARLTSRQTKLILPWNRSKASSKETAAAEAKFKLFCEADEANQLRCQEGLDLFGKWLRGIWL